jgi:hypothetical protein
MGVVRFQTGGLKMSGRISTVVITAALALIGERVIAGGPPMLCLPIDGVTAENGEECRQLLVAKLENKLLPDQDAFRAIQLREHASQWYVTLYFGEELGLSDVEAALEGSRFWIPRERLHLFGHLILKIDADAKSQAELLGSLKAGEYFLVADSITKDNRLFVTVNMPYPNEDLRRKPISFDRETFHWNHYASDPSIVSRAPATADMLPSCDMFHEIVAKHSASLDDIRWSTDHACRTVGGVAVTKPGAKGGQTVQAAVGR